MNPHISLSAKSRVEDMPNGHLSSTALYRLVSEGIVKLAHSVFPGDWDNKVLFITEISLRFVRAVKQVEETLTINANCEQDERLKEGIAKVFGDVRFDEQRLAVRFRGRIALR